MFYGAADRRAAYTTNARRGAGRAIRLGTRAERFTIILRAFRAKRLRQPLTLVQGRIRNTTDRDNKTSILRDFYLSR